MKRKGAFSIVFGSMVVFLLIIGNVYWLIEGENIHKRAELTFVPPMNTIIQALFYTPPKARQERESIGFLDDWGMDFSEEELTLFLNDPPVTAVVGREYRYEPKLDDSVYSDVELSLVNTPDGMRIESESIFVWTPDIKDVDSVVNISLGALADGSELYIIDFDVMVTPYNYLLGTDKMGRSVAGMIIEGTRWTLVSGFIAAFVALFIGAIAGAISGYYPGRISDIIDFIVQSIESIPGLLLFFLAAVIFEFNIYWIMVAVGLAFAPLNVKLIRALVRKFVNNQFVESSRELGFRDSVVLWRDIIWVNGRASIAAQICYCFAFAILAEVTLSYLGIGVLEINGASWGNMLMESRTRMGFQEYWMMSSTSLAIVTSVLGFYLLGDGLGKFLDYKENE